MIVKIIKKTFVLCAVTNTPPQFVGSAIKSIVLIVFTRTLVGVGTWCLLEAFGVFPHGYLLVLAGYFFVADTTLSSRHLASGVRGHSCPLSMYTNPKSKPA